MTAQSRADSGEASPLLRWIREQVDEWKPSIIGVFRGDALHEWPITADQSTNFVNSLPKPATSSPCPASRLRSRT